MKVIENGITAPKGFWQQALRRELKRETKRIWPWCIVRNHVRPPELLPPMW